MVYDTSPTFDTSPVHEINRLVNVVNGLETRLREQRALLAKQGIGLPAGILTGVQAVRTELDNIEKEATDSFTELSQLRELSRTTELINSTLQLQDVLQSVMDTVINLTKAERGYLILRNSDTGEMEFRIARHVVGQVAKDLDESIVSNTVVRQVAATGQAIVTTNAADDPRFADQKSVVNLALRSILCVPLLNGDQVTGVIYTDNRIKSGVFGKKEQDLLQAFANQAAVAIENAQLFASLQESLDVITAYKELIEGVFTSIASGVITTDRNDQITRLNEAAEQIFGIQDYVLGHPLWNVLSAFEDDLARLIQKVRDTQQAALLELERERTDGATASLNFRVSPLRDVTETASSGQAREDVQGLAIVIDDLTDLKQRQSQLRVVRRYLTAAMVDNIDSLEKLGLNGIRQLCTTLYVDVRDFHTFPAFSDPQDLMTLLNTYLSAASEAIITNSGIVNKYMANEVMALFNTQLNPDTDHAWNAVQTALAMEDEYRELYRLTHEPPDAVYFRVGINTGIATLGNVGSSDRREFTAIGDSVNVAHRMLETARPGEIVISDETARACGDRLFDPQYGIRILGTEEVSVKGRVGLVNIYRLARAR